MKLHFEPDLDYQRAAIEAVCDLFHGQEACTTEFTVVASSRPTGFLQGIGFESELGVGNRLQLLEEELLSNMRAVQLRNGLPPSEALRHGEYDFTVEMETGTGKTYVYLRTIFELNRRFGFSKFLIVVPSIAIKEGVYKTLQITREHFQALYGGVPYDYFLYDSAKLGQVRNFATSPNIQIMVVTVGAINKKDVNNLYKVSEKTNDEAPVALIRATRPIVIVDEPQTVDGGLEGQGRQALAEMHPLCTLRYSATHVDKHHMIYKLDAVDAYRRGLVKQIEVAGLEVDGGHNRPYIKVLATSNARGRFTAKLELDVQQAKSVKRKAVTVKPGDDLEQTTGRDVYANWLVNSIHCKAGEAGVDLSRLDARLHTGAKIGDVDPDGVARLMIRRTIEEHLDKELRLTSRDIKVLSLFFVDAVEHYRTYAADRSPGKGKYAVMFEQEYATAIARPKYRTLFRDVDTSTLPTDVHDGYFSRDKKGTWTDTGDTNQTLRDNAQRAYELIMKDKERLLAFDTKLKFIFSHSALREGWDNPNVFQICSLREMGSERERRQTIGRGLRLCVDQDGQRVRGVDPNTLTVIASESYEEFADRLQQEIEEETGFRFGVVEPHAFAAIAVPDGAGGSAPLGMTGSTSLHSHLVSAGYLDTSGRVTDHLRRALKSGSVELPSDCPAPAAVLESLRKIAGKLEIRDARKRQVVKTRQAVLEGAEFRALWDRIKHKTTYRVQFDSAKLIADCVAALAHMPFIPRAQAQIKTADLTIERAGVTAQLSRADAPVVLEEHDIELPDVLTYLQDQTNLTRRSLARILIESGRLEDFRANPQQFIALATEVIKRTKQLAIVDGIRYQRIGDSDYYAQELFEAKELLGYLDRMVKSEKSVYEHVSYDSAGVERSFAEDLEHNTAVKVYVKLPDWFTIPTPLGTYNPDWAVVLDDHGDERLFFVVETKGSLLPDDLRITERAKIACGRAHFEAVGSGETPAAYVVARTLKDVFDAAHAQHR